MNDGQFTQIQGWFENLSRKFESLDQKVESLDRRVFSEFGSIRENMVTKQQFENRFQALLAATMNLHERVEGYKDHTDSEIGIIKRALRDLDNEIKQIRKS